MGRIPGEVENAPVPTRAPLKAVKPFYFNTSEHLLRIEREKAANLSELLRGLQTCSDDSIFQHTFRTLQEHHFIRQGFTNDFAHWSYSACKEAVLAEQLARVDVRQFTAIEELRRKLVEIVDGFLREHSQSGPQSAHESFYFCASDIVVLPTPFVASSIPAFLDGLKQVSVHSIHHHFIEARLRLRRMSNDFSHWLEQEFALAHPSEAIERIDIYATSMEEVRQQIVHIIEQVLRQNGMSK